MAFWLINLAWLLALRDSSIPPVPMPAVLAGWIALAAWCATFTGVFASLVSYSIAKLGVVSWSGNSLHVILLSLAWAVLEYLRSFLFTGFPWNMLGASQYQNLALIQVAEWGGVYLVSVVIMAMNLCVVLVALRRFEVIRSGKRSRFHPELTAGLAALAVSIIFSRNALSRIHNTSPEQSILVAVIQPGVPQQQKWSPEYEERIYQAVGELTAEAVREVADADLIVWPETAIPGLLEDERNQSFLQALTLPGIPILAGIMSVAEHEGYYNSAVLAHGPPAEWARYHKQHLVPVGEYVPAGGILKALGIQDPLGFSCVPGKGSGVFRLPTGDIRCAALICFEDAFPALSRKAVRDGARVLVNQTNDAWFDGTALSRQHMVQSVFRAIENRVPVVRAGNTGLSCLITIDGKIHFLRPDDPAIGKSLMGAVGCDLYPADAFPTVYRRFGDLLYQLLLAPVLGAFLLALRYGNGKDKSSASQESVRELSDE